VVKALHLALKALHLALKALLLHHPLASPENTGFTRVLNTPFLLARTTIFSTFASENEE